VKLPLQTPNFRQWHSKLSAKGGGRSAPGKGRAWGILALGAISNTYKIFGAESQTENAFITN
jgi:hypothetical protein